MNRKTLRGMSVLLGCLLLQSAIVGIFNNTQTLFLTPVCDALNFSRGSFSACKTIMGTLSAVLMPLSRKLLDNKSFRAIILSSSIILSAAIYCMQFCTAIYQFYILSVIQGLCCAVLLLLPVPIVINNWFHKGTGVFLSAAFCMSGLSSALFSPVLAKTIESYTWKGGYVCISLIVLFAGVVSGGVLVKKPEDVGLQPFGAENNCINRETSNTQTTAIPLHMEARIVIFALFTLCAYSGVSVGSHISSFASSLGYPISNAAYFNSVIMVGNISMKLLYGVLVTKLSGKRTAYLGLGAMLCGLLILSSEYHPILPIGAFLCGNSFAITTVLLSCLVRECFPEHKFSETYAWFSMIGGLASSFVTGLSGSIYDIAESYRPVMLLLALMMVIAIMAFTMFNRIPPKGS